ncbi:enoyl-CoA hydratase/isomerase family protein [Niveispirillum sp.]|uniref:enoyl-CoA hydratase/isomerase family protein n=1 Tax=Niveispirillum sp. TaxID=1917217 RepID=UPI001B4A637A|nr:enoyl-CoA hydratase/isomerase family protein [Niveispirillum sp.]MBP7336872.1 enoyl-CoA hydratase/isomerase family protein [Niveispirillum sp.]
MPPYPHLILSVEDGVGILQLNHPEKRNALGWELHHEIIAALSAWAEDDAVACVLVIGNEDYFCAGWRLDILNSIEGDERRRFTDLALKFMKAFYDFPKPMVAAVAGVAPGYGMDVANMCDITIASENAAFGSTQVKYAMNGFYHGMLQRIGTQRARRMLFTGDPISAQEALRVGLVDEVVPYGTLRETALRLARQIAEAGPELLAVLKDVALRAGNMDHLSALAFELSVTQDLTQRGLFKRRIADGNARLKAGTSKATERLGAP